LREAFIPQIKQESQACSAGRITIPERPSGRRAPALLTLWKMNLNEFTVKMKIKLGKICRVRKIDSIESVRIDSLSYNYKKLTLRMH
jgi:hypothetical protein